MRGKGEGAVYRVPKDKSLPLKYWTGTVELPPGPSGERRRKTVRRKSKAQLMGEISALRSDLEKRGDLPTAGTTVEKWFAYWLTNIAAKKVRPNTLDGYRRTVNNHIIPAIGKVKLEKVTAAHVRRVHDAVTAKGNNHTTALLAHRTMSVSFKSAVREGRLGRNPASLTDAPRKAAVELEALTLPEAVNVLARVATTPDAALWSTFLLTGARRGEVVGLEWDRVTDVLDLSWQMIRIAWKCGCGNSCARPQDCPKRTTTDTPADYEYRHVNGGLYWTRPKSSTSWRIIPLLDPLKSVLDMHRSKAEPNPWGLVFTKAGRPLSPDVATKAWPKMLKEAGIDKHVRLHDARHTTVDLLYAAGVPEDLIQEIVGHSTRAQTQGYKSLRNRERLTAAMEQFSMLFTPTAPALESPSSNAA